MLATQNNNDSSKLTSTGQVRGGRIVLGFSGGLDTSYCVKYLTDDKGYEVHSIIVNTGGFSEDELKQIEEHAYKLGVKTHTTVDAVKGYYDRRMVFDGFLDRAFGAAPSDQQQVAGRKGGGHIRHDHFTPAAQHQHHLMLGMIMQWHIQAAPRIGLHLY